MIKQVVPAVVLIVFACCGPVFGAAASSETQVEDLVRSYAPRFWFHAADEGPSDPLSFLKSSSLWFRRPGAKDVRLVERGEIEAAELARLWRGEGPARPSESQGGAGLYLKWEPSKSKALRRAPAKDGWSGIPLLWRLGENVRDDLLLIEYWFHADFSGRGFLGIGDHEGDWEGVAALVRVEFSGPGVTAHRLIAMYFAAHEGGRWECWDKLEWHRDEDGTFRPEAFSSRGTHATYPRPGKYVNKIFFDHARRDRPWDAWKYLRPLEREPYFGFSGGWGKVHRLAFMSGPMPPNAAFKSMPRKRGMKRMAEVVESCTIRPT